MRELRLSDVFAVSRIFNKMNINLEFKKGMTEEQLGMMFFQSFFMSLGNAEKEVLAFLGDLKGMKPDAVAKMNLDQGMQLIKEFKDKEDLKGFFTQVAEFMR